MVESRFAFEKLALLQFAPESKDNLRLVLDRLALIKNASAKLALLILTSLRFAPVKFASSAYILCKSVPEKLAFSRFAIKKLDCLKLAFIPTTFVRLLLSRLAFGQLTPEMFEKIYQITFTIIELCTADTRFGKNSSI